MEIGVVFDGPRGGCDTVSMCWMGFNTACGVRGRVGGSMYHTVIPNVKLGKLRVSMTGLLRCQMVEKSRESYGSRMNPNNSMMTVAGVAMWSGRYRM